ncbi:MAG: glycosyltransferase family 4 protein [Flexilinea sp.]
MSRKILIIVENLPVPFDTRVWAEATTLVQNGHSVSVICPIMKGYEKKYEELEGVRIYRHSMPVEGNGIWGYLKEYASALWSEYKLAKEIFRKEGFDVIHACNPPDLIFLVAKPFKRKGVKFVFDHHDLCPELFEAKFNKKGLLYQTQILFEKLTYKSADFAFVTNESYRRIAIDRGKMDPDKVKILRSGPKLERMKIQPPKQEIKRGKKFMVGYVGVIGQQEGIEYLLEAAKYIRDAMGRDDIFWGVVGSGPHLEALRKRCTQMGLDDIVEFTGRVSDEVMLDYLNTADVCVNPDVWDELNDKSTMNKVLEYMALGKPIVQFDLTEGRVSAQNASLYAMPNDEVDLATKIIVVLNDKELREKMGIYGRERIEKFLNWAQTSAVLIYAYDNLII